MATTATSSVALEQPRRLEQPRVRINALSEIGYNSIAAVVESDASTSGDEVDRVRSVDAENDANSVIGVSIGQAQTRLTSPTTPAAEKAAAIARSGGFFGDKWIDATPDDVEGLQESSRESLTETQIRQTSSNEAKKEHASWDFATSSSSVPNGLNKSTQLHGDVTPSQWQPQPTEKASRSRTNTFRHSISSLSGALSQHKRNSSLSEMSRKLHDFSMPSLPKTPAFLQNISVSGLLTSFDGTAASKSEGNEQRANDRAWQSSVISQSREQSTDLDGSQEGRPRFQQRRSTICASPVSGQSPDGPIRSPSIDALSLAPSLGDDSRWLDIRQQVNSRKKAIADTLDDLHLPSLPSLPQLSSFNLGPSTKGRAAAERGSDATDETIDTRSKGSAEQAAYPQFYRALETLEGDLVLLGGYRGSVLRSATADARRLWVPLGVTMNLRKVDLEVGLNPEDEETEETRVIASKMLSHIGPIDLSRRLLKRLRNCPNAKRGTLRVHDWGWDWRLSPHLNSKKLRQFLINLPCNQPGVEESRRGAIVIAHSLGGLITRHAINQQPELFSRILYAGEPQHAVNILGPLRHGDDVALNSRVLTAQVNFTIRTSFALLPLSGQCFYNANSKEELPVDFFNVDHWKEYRWSPVIGRPLPAPVVPASASRTSIVDSMTDLLSTKANRTVEKADASLGAPQMNAGHDTAATNDPKDPKTAVTIPYPKAIEYLERTLAETKKFLEELAHKPELEGRYPHFALIYGKNIPTCRGAKVDGREGIKRSDAYDNLLFGSGDGVVLARAAMLPTGYRTVKKGVSLSEKSHVSLLSDLEAVGKCLCALQDANRHIRAS